MTKQLHWPPKQSVTKCTNSILAGQYPVSVVWRKFREPFTSHLLADLDATKRDSWVKRMRESLAICPFLTDTPLPGGVFMPWLHSSALLRRRRIVLDDSSRWLNLARSTFSFLWATLLNDHQPHSQSLARGPPNIHNLHQMQTYSKKIQKWIWHVWCLKWSYMANKAKSHV